MGMKQLYEAVNKLPQQLKESYGFLEPFDYSRYEAIEYPGYVYYPELSCIIMDGIEATWPKGTLDIDNPAHVNELKQRIMRRAAIGAIGIARWLEPGHRMICMVSRAVPKGFEWIPIEETRIYYKPEEMDLKNDPTLALLARCLFLFKRCEQVQVFPDAEEEPEFWEGN